ncbi:GNAT family N-acetyltransferase [Arsenicicoccus sp. oral taxon 190]|uniref:GNAT family N-acetyltransferase n=1 Tax=Arsenicicoccus sp. oral taxon 190 TaxID=1658671 RepID=UPI000679EB46|nr:GNAT family N-acetyltransferase [Arsenicicoccus sp. oral taxon 190]AKT52169.1 hypothetical protein ADJ73_14405 [Arsenicicoccus sp. oral taxon 190]
MPHHATTVRTTTDPREFLRDIAPLVREEPVIHSLPASVARRAEHDPAAGQDARWYSLWREGRVVGAAMHTPPHPPHLAFASPLLAVALAREITRSGRRPDGVGGLRDGAMAFSDWWCVQHGLDADVVMDLGMYDLPAAPRLPWPVAGELRVALAEDLELVRRWLDAFHAEAAPHSPPPPDPSRHVLDGRTALWVSGGAPVAMCWASAPEGGVTRISAVYTPPEHRGHGYASAVVAGWSAEQQARGRRCMLFTDLANPTSNGIYQALGYRRIGDSVTLRFGPQQSG